MIPSIQVVSSLFAIGDRLAVPGGDAFYLGTVYKIGPGGAVVSYDKGGRGIVPKSDLNDCVKLDPHSPKSPRKHTSQEIRKHQKAPAGNSSPVVRSVDSEPDLMKALDILYRWYNASSIISVDKNTVKNAFGVLAKKFGYVPWNKDVYRAFPISRPMIATLKEGQKLVLRVGVHEIQSWTTSARKAERFGTYLDRSYVVVRLLGKAHEIANNRWLVSVLKTLAKDPKTRKTALGLLDDLRLLRKEDEVVLESSKANKVEVIQVFLS